MKQRAFGLDILRATAILCVLISHGRYFIGSYIPGSFRLRVLGFIGVELFFVLSGFLIGAILLAELKEFDQPSRLTNFWVRRWLRTIPNYWLFLAVNLGLAAILSVPLPNLLSYVFFVQNLFQPHPEFMVEAWSLAVEEWFYFSFSILLFLAYRMTRSQKAFLVLSLLFLVIPTIHRVIWVTWYDPPWDESVRKIVALRLDAVMYGMLAAWVKSSFVAGWNRWKVPCLGLSIILSFVCLVLLGFTNINEGFFQRTFLFSLLSLGFTLALPFFDSIVRVKPSAWATGVTATALWSYSLYLCNLPVYGALTLVTGGERGQNLLIDGLSTAAFFVLSFVIAYVVYTFYEKPIMNLRDRRSLRIDRGSIMSARSPVVE